MRERGERASVLVLMPAAVMVLMILGAIACDFSLVWLRQRELANAVAAAANDAAAQALADSSFYAGGAVALDELTAHRVAAGALAGAGIEPLGPPVVEVDGPRVRVQARLLVPLIFAKAVPGAPRSATVMATSTATARRGTP